MKKIMIFLAAIGMSDFSSAGINGLTAHSRANCLSINESISWDLTRHWFLETYTYHYRPNQNPHIPWHEDRRPINHGNEFTWRSAAIHLGESVPGPWKVKGIHIRRANNRDEIFKRTEAINCNIYDGWWDSDHPERKS